MRPDERLPALLDAAAHGRFPAPDGRVEVLPAPAGKAQGVVAFTGHHVVAADVDAAWVRERMPDGDLLAPTSPAVLHALARHLRRTPDALDLVLVARGTGTGTDALVPTDATHPRLQRAAAHRIDVRPFTDADGATVLALGRGLAGRMEVAFEVDPAARGHGRARRALTAARALVHAGEPLWAQASPGNTASVRTLLAAGFVPVCGEVLLFCDPPR